MKFEFSSKSKTLAYLEHKLVNSKVLPQYVFTVNDFLNDEQNVFLKIQESFSRIIVRSSCLAEDLNNKSSAGVFESVLDVDCKNTEELRSSILLVVNSYEDHNIQNEILIQPFLVDVQSSGVAFTSDPDTLTDYFVINYDNSGLTDSITSGTSQADETLIILKRKYNKNLFKDVWIPKLIEALIEIENLLQKNSLDVEFGISRGEVFIFQVRPIVRILKEDLSGVKLIEPLQRLEKKIDKLGTSHPRVLGDKALFGVMPDWNPAEIIGLRPKPLSLSLYKEIVTDSVWAFQRSNYGYRNLISHPLLVNFLGIPYIDVRLSFNSFIPADLSEKTSKKLVNFYLETLIKNPHLHDKIEFEIVMSCYVLGMEKKTSSLLSNNFNNNEIQEIFSSLKRLTLNIISPATGFFRSDMKKIEKLETCYDQIVSSNLSLVDKIYWLIEDCKRFGTLPFAGIARSAFVATQLLDSFVSEAILTAEEKAKFQTSFYTVSKKLGHDLICFRRGEITKEDFLSRYGHLRPGTYDINSARYDEDFDGYFSKALSQMHAEDFVFSEEHITKIQFFLDRESFNLSAIDIINFIKHSIEGRELSKFIFTKSLSRVLVLVEEYGGKVGISKKDLAFVDFQEIKRLYSALQSDQVSNYLKNDIKQNKSEYQLTKAVKLPSLIMKGSDVFCFFIDKSIPNFITLKQVRGETIFVDDLRQDIEGKIAIIKSADPGYDYLFTKNIIGLITCFGGVNSHMAVRCAELGIPAAIGVGEKLFNQLIQMKYLEIDSLGKSIRIIQ
jgi:hypothetical protein